MARINIREEVSSDTAAIRAVHEAAFNGSEEADIVEALRGSGAITVSLVAVDEGGRVVGNVVFSPVAIDGPEGRTYAQGLAPLGVLPELQRSGVGSALARAGLERVRGSGVVVLGDPAYYSRFGFREARESGLAWEVAGHERSFQALGAFQGSGTVRYRPEVMGFRVRRARVEEFAAIQELELAAAKRFESSAHPQAAALPALGLDVLSRAEVWVVTKGAALAAYVAWEPCGSDAYVLEVDVHPSHAGSRLGAALLDHVGLVSRRRLLLRTFSDVPWNAPYYRRLGFRDVETPSTLDEVVRSEVAQGLSRRVTLARSYPHPDPLPEGEGIGS